MQVRCQELFFCGEFKLYSRHARLRTAPSRLAKGSPLRQQ